MKNLKKLLAMCLSVIMIFSCIPAAFAADVANATIDEAAKGSLTLYKYDLTNAEKDGVWDSSYVSTGVYDETTTPSPTWATARPATATLSRVSSSPT